MEPLIQEGQMLRVVPAARYRAGDVVATIGLDGRVYAHRLLGSLSWRGRRLYLTQADRGTRPDAATPHILGLIDCGATPTSRVRWRSRARFAQTLLRRAVTRLVQAACRPREQAA